jgi:hypothetical protein
MNLVAQTALEILEIGARVAGSIIDHRLREFVCRV